VLGPDEVLIRVLARAARRCLMGSPGGSRKDLRDMLAFAAEHGIRPRINRVPLEHLSITLDEMNKGHMSGRKVVVME
jgi:D-arabinose 1-dehydrogenase-like Zn-dependent alcohol dehydrogenase